MLKNRLILQGSLSPGAHGAKDAPPSCDSRVESAASGCLWQTESAASAASPDYMQFRNEGSRKATFHLFFYVHFFSPGKLR